MQVAKSRLSQAARQPRGCLPNSRKLKKARRQMCCAQTKRIARLPPLCRNTLTTVRSHPGRDCAKPST
ncbi:hypothetical protein LEMLEM_LOCUS18324 [Lemmus lemmus]